MSLVFTYLLLALYAAPLAAMVVSVFTSDYFNRDSKWVYFASIVSTTFGTYLREGLGKLILPGLTAYSIQKPGGGRKIPKHTIALAVVFLCFVIMGLAMRSQTAPETLGPRIDNFGAGTAKVYQDQSLEYLTEGLSYIALLFGVSLNLKKS